MYYDPVLPRMDYSNFRTKREDFLEHYRDAAEPMPHYQPSLRGWPVTTTAFVDASHAAIRKTRKSYTGYFMFINRAPIIWYRKRQKNVETSSFSSEFIALKACTKAIVSLWFKLQIFGIPMVAGHTKNVLCDNKRVVNNSSKVESVLNKTQNSLSYHYVRWAVSAGIITVGWIARNENLADVFTKYLSEPVQAYLFENWCY